MRIVKKKIILPLMVFIVGISVLAVTLCAIRAGLLKQNREMANLNAVNYAEHIKTDLMSGIGVVETLEQVLVSENGKIEKFTQIAENMMTSSIQSIQIAPEGIVTDIYPEEGNEVGRIDLIHDTDRGKISCYARDNHVMIMQGPFKLKQGGYGIAVRNPVYLQNNEGQKTFWGFTIVIIRVPDIFDESFKSLSDFGYRYRLLKMVSPWDMTYEVVDSSDGEIVNPVSYTFEMGGIEWKLEVMPQSEWKTGTYMYGVLGGGMVIVLLLTGLTCVMVILDEHRKRFKGLAVTDALTGIYNRHGFDELVTRYLKEHPKNHCIGVQFDIDDFKFINDMYGHTSGDRALQALAGSMRDFFGGKAFLGRSGGDEFCIFLPDCAGDEAKELMEKFTKLERTFEYDGEEHTFSISLGYAEYPLHACDYRQLMRCADAALYQVKLRGKNGCMAYRDGISMEIRTRLGFALNDVSENLPGAFIIYRASKDDDTIFFANRELIKLTGCRDMDDLLDYTGNSFSGLIREDEREMVEQDIWQQINEENVNDYVHFHMKKKDGSCLHVLDHGRIVENGRYGEVFYVLIMSSQSIEEHYK